eukprot:m51a1_g10841 hypothetical protein (349) ;mRNA; r:22627-23770
MLNAVALVTALLIVSSLGCDDRCQWDEWKEKHAKVYHSVEEEELRFQVFVNNLADYAAWNAEPGQTAIYGPNQFSDLNGTEFSQRFLHPTGIKPSGLPLMEAPDAPVKRASVPKTYTTPYVTPARNQGTCGSCWAFTVAAVLEGAYMRTHKKTLAVSTQNLVDCANYGQSGYNGCQGYFPDRMLAELVQRGRSGGGVALESQYPYLGRMSSCRKSLSNPGAVITKSYFTQRVDEADGSALYSRLMQYGSLGVAMNAGYLQGYSGGIVKHGSRCVYTSQGYNGADHAVTLAGWGEQNGIKYWLIKNSWGSTWGEAKDYHGSSGEGFFRLQRGTKACHIADSPAVGATVA